jgi:hypothetical protein
MSQPAQATKTVVRHRVRGVQVVTHVFTAAPRSFSPPRIISPPHFWPIFPILAPFKKPLNNFPPPKNSGDRRREKLHKAKWERLRIGAHFRGRRFRAKERANLASRSVIAASAASSSLGMSKMGGRTTSSESGAGSSPGGATT